MTSERTVMFKLPTFLSGKLTCVAGTEDGRSWELSAGTFVIGRSETCDLHLATEAGVSKVHAKIILEDDRYVILDCESRNGTVVNGSPVQRQVLLDGDEVRICGCILHFSAQGAVDQPMEIATKVRDIDVPEEATDMLARRPPVQPVHLELSALQGSGAKGRLLATWYLCGLLGSLLFGGTAIAAIFVSQPAQADRAQTISLPSEAPAIPPLPEAGSGAQAPVPEVAPSVAAPAVAQGEDVKAAPAVAQPMPVAEAEKDLADDEEPAEVAAVESPARPTPVTSIRRPAPPSARAPAVAARRIFSAIVDDGKSEALRTRGGKVRVVDARDGEIVSKGQTLVTFEDGANTDEVATLVDRIASLDGAEDEEARRELKAAKAKLDALQGSKSAPITAGMAGRLSGFTVAAGEVLRSGETVGRIVEAELPRRVKVSVDRQLNPKRGQEVVLVLRQGGEGAGSVLSINGRMVTVDTGDVAAADVGSVRF